MRHRLLSVACYSVLMGALISSSSMGQARPSTNERSPEEAWLARLRLDARRPIDFHATVQRESVFVNEQVTWQAAVLINERIRDRLRRNPEFVPPALQGVMAFDLGTPTRAAARASDGSPFEAYLFRRALFPVAPGTLQIPSPQLSYRLPPNAGYFSREESFMVRAESTTVVVRPLPETGRPATFSGAVGQYTVAARLDAAEVMQGEPLLLTVRVYGVGNVALLTRPSIVVSWGTTVNGSERVAIDTSTRRVRGEKEFDFVITPRDTGAVELSPVTYAYFDPARSVYAIASTPALPLRIRPGTLVPPDRRESGTPDAASAPALRPWHASGQGIGSPRARVIVGWLWWTVLPMFSVLMMLRQRWSGAAAMAPIVMRPHDDEDGSVGSEARRLRREMLEQLADRLALSSAALTDMRDMQRALRFAGVTREVTESVLHVLEQLAQTGFGDGRQPTLPPDDAQVRALLHQVDAEALGRAGRRGNTRRALGRGTWWIVLLVSTFCSLVAGRTVRAAPRGDSADSALVRTMVDQATASFARQDFPASARLWARAVAVRPNDVALLANWGEAAWRGGDTVTTVVAWHRALREAPTDMPLRERMRVLPAGARDGWALIPAVRASWLWIAGGVCWAIGWLLMPRRKRGERSGPLIAIGVGALLAIAGRWVSHRARLEDMAVVHAPTILREAPTGEAGTAGGVATGDMARILATRDGWHRVETVDGRIGWVPISASLTLLVAPANR